MKKAIVLGGGGFIGHHLIKRLKLDGYYVVAVDLKRNDFETSLADEFLILDLRNQLDVFELFKNSYDEVYQLAADMGAHRLECLRQRRSAIGMT